MNEGAGNQDRRNPLLRGFLTQISNPKVVVFFGSVFVAILPSEVPG
jgi:threonine/homoserine/homoserine lactone efflux protein